LTNRLYTVVSSHLGIIDGETAAEAIGPKGFFIEDTSKHEPVIHGRYDSGDVWLACLCGWTNREPATRDDSYFDHISREVDG
jgi:hypothetical protein